MSCERTLKRSGDHPDRSDVRVRLWLWCSASAPLALPLVNVKRSLTAVMSVSSRVLNA